MRKLMLEALTWRYYRIRKLTNFRSVAVDGQCCASAEYDHEGKRIHVFATHAEYSRLGEAARTLFPLIAEVPADHDVVIDFYVCHSGRLGDPEATQQEVHAVLNAGRLPAPDPAHRSGSRRHRSRPGYGRHAAFHLSPQRGMGMKRRSSTAESIP